MKSSSDIVVDVKAIETLDVREGSVLVLRTTGFADLREFVKQLSERFKDTRLTIILLDERQTLECLDERQMNAVGWYRREPGATNGSN